MSDQWNRSEQEDWDDLMSQYPAAEPYIEAAYRRDVEIDALNKRIDALEKRLDAVIKSASPIAVYVRHHEKGNR